MVLVTISSVASHVTGRRFNASRQQMFSLESTELIWFRALIKNSIKVGKHDGQSTCLQKTVNMLDRVIRSLSMIFNEVYHHERKDRRSRVQILDCKETD